MVRILLRFSKRVRHAYSQYRCLFLLAELYRAGFPPVRYRSRYRLSEISYAGIYDEVMAF